MNYPESFTNLPLIGQKPDQCKISIYSWQHASHCTLTTAGFIPHYQIYLNEAVRLEAKGCQTFIARNEKNQINLFRSLMLDEMVSLNLNGNTLAGERARVKWVEYNKGRVEFLRTTEALNG